MTSRLSALIGAVILTGALAAGCTSDDSGDVGESTTSTTESIPGMGTPVKGDGATVTVNAAYETDTIRQYTDGSWTTGQERPSEEVTARDKGKFVVVETTVTNDTNRDMDLTCRSTGGYVDAVLQTDREALYQPIKSLYEIPGNPACNADLGSGFDSEMTWIFEIPEDREALSFNFLSNTSDGEDTAFIRLDKLGEKPSTTAKEPEPTDAPDAAAVEPEANAYTPEAQPTPEVEQYDPDPVIGFTGAPSVDSPHVLDKEISSCGDPSIHETGTTFFTDGTSGWTSTCAAQMG
jgi:hypothetical protein